MRKKKETLEREEAILLSLKKLDFLSRSQIQKLHSIKSARTANRVMQEIKDFVAITKDDKEHVYYLNKEGRQLVGSDKIIKKTPKLKHYLMRNDLYIHLQRPTSWKNEIKITFPNKKDALICDAMYKNSQTYVFVEVDRIQKMNENIKKIKKYKKLANNSDFKLVWLTTTEYRKKRLKKLCEGLDVTIYTEEDLR